MSDLSLRLLARRLGTSTATLYRHIASKDELMAHVVDQFFAQLRQPSVLPADLDWQHVLRYGALRFRALLNEHPNVVPLIVAQVPLGPNALAVRETAIATLIQTGLSIELAARSYTTIAHYVIGFAVQQRADDNDDTSARLADYYRRLDPATFPATIAAIESLTGVTLNDEFTEGLDSIIRGTAQLTD